MKKRLKLSTLIKRTLLTVLSAIIIVVILVYAFDKYSPTTNSVNNKYDDAYWEQEVLEGFMYADDIYAQINKYDQSKPEYVLPWIADGKTQAELSDEELIYYGRYTEEVNKITTEFTNKYSELTRELNKWNLVGAWDFNRPVTDWIEVRLGLVAADYLNEEFATELSAYDFVVSKNYSGTKEEFILILQMESDIESALEDADYNYDTGDGDTEFEEAELETLAYAIANDPTLYQEISVFDRDAYNAVVNEHAYYADLIAKREEYNKTLYEWRDYYKNTLLGYGGLATAYPNKPVMTIDTEKGGTLEFWFNSYLTTFKLVEKDADGNEIQTWLSNPDTEDPKANGSVKKLQQSILNLSYSVLKGQTDVYSTYEYAVSETNDYNDVLSPNYAVNFDVKNNKIVVWYKLVKRGIDYTYFPKYISATKMEEYLARSTERAANGVVISDGTVAQDINSTANSKIKTQLTTDFYKLISKDDATNEFGYDYYEFSGTHAAMSGLVRNFLVKYLQGWCGYTEEDLMSDNLEFGYELNTSKPEYSVAIEYELTPSGLNVTVPGNSIKEDANYPLTYIDVLPYFTATEQSIDGYTIIPDGSGAILEHNNGRNYAKYQKRVYTTDLTNTSLINKGSFEELMFPMYAVVNTSNNSGMLVHVTSNAAQMQLTADISGRQDSYNVHYFTAYLREQTEIIVGQAAYEKKTLIKWTNAKVENDISVNYELLSTDELSYSKVAKKYREILEEMYDFNGEDTTKSPVLDMDVIGVYTYRENFLGIPYTAKDTLTTIDQFNEMVSKFKSLGIENINAFYLGWRNTGLSSVSFEKIKVSKMLGSKDKFEALLNEPETGVTVYPHVTFGEFNEYQESFGKSHYTTHSVDGDVVFRQPYDLNSNIYDETKAKIYALSPRYYVAFGNTLAENFKKATNDYNAIAIDMLGSTLSGDYRKGRETFKVDAVNNQLQALENLTSAGIDNLVLYTPYDYAFKYTSVAKNIPYQTTQYEILDYSIPFYQLVVNGMFDYSGESVNAENGKGIDEHIMRMIETGSNISFTFTGDSSEKLIQTDYNYYYYTLYTDWVEDVETIYNTLNDLGIYGCELVEHEYLTNNVFKVVYESSTEEITIYLNYSRNQYVAADGTVVEGKSYAVAV